VASKFRIRVLQHVRLTPRLWRLLVHMAAVNKGKPVAPSRMVVWGKIVVQGWSNLCCSCAFSPVRVGELCTQDLFTIRCTPHLFGKSNSKCSRAIQVPMQEFICDLRFRHLNVWREAKNFMSSRSKQESSDVSQVVREF